MATVGDPTDLPNEFFVGVVNDVIKQEKFEEFKTNVTVASSKGENYLGLLYRIEVKGTKKDEPNAQLNLIYKLPLQSEELRKKFPLGVLYKREVFVYNTLLPELSELQNKFDIPESEKFRYIKSYKASSDEYKEFVLMDDMSALGFSMAERRKSLEYKHLALVLKNLAAYHALSFVLKKENPSRYEYLASNLGGIQDYTEEFMYFIDLSKDRAVAAMDEPIFIDKLNKYGEDLREKLKYYLNKDIVDNYTVLCHGDCWNNNVLFKFEEGEPIDIRLLDWQVARNASPITDIAYLMFNSTDETLRKNHFNELMNHYHACLERSLNYMGYNVEDCYPKAIFEEHLKKILPFGLLMAFMVLPAILGEAEDVLDMDVMLKKDKIEASDLKFENKGASDRYASRMKGVVSTFIDMDLI